MAKIDFTATSGRCDYVDLGISKSKTHKEYITHGVINDGTGRHVSVGRIEYNKEEIDGDTFLLLAELGTEDQIENVFVQRLSFDVKVTAF